MPKYRDSRNIAISIGDRVKVHLNRDDQVYAYDGQVVKLANPPGAKIVQVSFVTGNLAGNTGWVKAHEITVQA